MGKKFYNEADIQDIADAIRTKGGSGTFKVSEMADAIENLPSGGGDEGLEALFAGTATGGVEVTLPEIAYNFSLTLGYTNKTNINLTGLTAKGIRIWGDATNGNKDANGGLRFAANASNLKYIRLPDCEELCFYKYNAYVNAFSSLEEFTAPKLTRMVGDNRQFSGYNPGKLQKFICPNFYEGFPSNMFYNNPELTIVDTKTLRIADNVFNSCTTLTAVVIRRNSVAQLTAVNSFASTPIASGTGYIYVPRALISSYEAATNWSTYAAQFRALEDYTDDGTIDGKFIPPA